MPIFDVECKKCGKIVEDVWLKVDENPEKCPECGEEMVKCCNCSHFKLLYDNKKHSCGWASDGYESSQYYREVSGDLKK